MNRYQRLIVAATVINLLVVCFFPPFTDQPLAYGVKPSFDGFYPIISQLNNKPIHTELLTIQILFIIANAIWALAALQLTHREGTHNYRHGLGISVFAAANLAVILLFPPFSPYSTALKESIASFDNFYFFFGSRSERPVFTPLLYIECIFVLINVLSIYLLFSATARNENAQKQRLLDMASNMSDDELAQLTSSMRKMVEDHRAKNNIARLGRKKERRVNTEISYRGTERRARKDRRNR